jgi:hypothetical protein
MERIPRPGICWSPVKMRVLTRPRLQSNRGTRPRRFRRGYKAFHRGVCEQVRAFHEWAALRRSRVLPVRLAGNGLKEGEVIGVVGEEVNSDRVPVSLPSFRSLTTYPIL